MCCKASCVSSKITLITGPIGSGKTRYLNRFLYQDGAGGILAPSNTEKTTYHLQSITTGDRRIFLSEEMFPNSVKSGRFYQSEETRQWANELIIAELSSFSSIVFDELGKFELHGGGLTPAFVAALNHPNLEIYASVRDTNLKAIIDYYNLKQFTVTIIDLLAIE